MPTVEQLGVNVGDKVKLPIRSIDGTKTVGMHNATVVGISPTRTFIDPPVGDYNLAVLNSNTGEIRDLYQRGPNAGYRNQLGGWVVTGYGLFRILPDPDKGEKFVQHIHSGYILFQAVR